MHGSNVEELFVSGTQKLNRFPPSTNCFIVNFFLKSVFYPIHLALTCSRDVFIYCVAIRVRLPDF